MAMGMGGGGGGGGMSGGGGGGGGGGMSAAMSAAMSGGGMSAAMSAAMSGGGMSGGGGMGMGMGGTRRPADPQPRSFADEMGEIMGYAAQNADSQADAAIRTNEAFQDQAQESTQEIAANLDNDYTRAARANLTGAQAGVDQVQSAQTGLGQLRDQYAAQGQDPAMQRLNQQALGQLYSPDQIRAGQVAADQVQGASVADIGNMDYARLGQVADVQGPAGYTADQVRARNIRAAQAGAVADVQGASVGGFERVGGTQVSSIDPMQAARIARTQGVSTQNIRASAAERALMDEVRGGGLLGQLQSQASSDLALGGSLSAEQSRDAIQSARAGMAARGLGVGNSALAAEMLNRDRFASQRDTERRAFAGQVLGQATGIQQAANQAYASRMEGNRARDLQAGLANQSVDANRAIQQAQLRQQANLTTNQNEQQRVLAEAGYAQQAGLSNQDFGFRAASQDAQLAQQAALQNQATALSLGQSNAQLRQAAAIQSAQNSLSAQQANQAANARAMEFAQQGGLQARLANQQAGLSQAAEQARLQQAALGTSFEAAQQRAMANAGYQQQAALSNQDANLRAAQYNVGQDMAAQQANQQANQAQEQYNRAFLGQVAGMNFDQNQARTSMLSGLYGQQAGLGQTTAALQQGMAQSQVALDPYQRALGSNMPIATIAPSAGMIGQAYGQTLGYGSDLFNTNTNMQASIYNTYNTNQAALKAAKITGGASSNAGWMAMMGGMAQGAGALGGGYLAGR